MTPSLNKKDKVALDDIERRFKAKEFGITTYLILIIPILGSALLKAQLEGAYEALDDAVL